MASRKQDIIVEDGAVYVLRAGTRIYVKTADICRMIGKSNQWVGQLVSRGTLNKKTTPHGALFELPEAMSDYCDMLEDRNGPEPSEKEQRQEAAQKAGGGHAKGGESHGCQTGGRRTARQDAS